jgi:hypothetical protein
VPFVCPSIHVCSLLTPTADAVHGDVTLKGKGTYSFTQFCLHQGKRFANFPTDKKNQEVILTSWAHMPLPHLEAWRDHLYESFRVREPGEEPHERPFCFLDINGRKPDLTVLSMGKAQAKPKAGSKRKRPSTAGRGKAAKKEAKADSSEEAQSSEDGGDGSDDDGEDGGAGSKGDRGRKGNRHKDPKKKKRRRKAAEDADDFVDPDNASDGQSDSYESSEDTPPPPPRKKPPVRTASAKATRAISQQAAQLKGALLLAAEKRLKPAASAAHSEPGSEDGRNYAKRQEELALMAKQPVLVPTGQDSGEPSELSCYLQLNDMSESTLRESWRKPGWDPEEVGALFILSLRSRTGAHPSFPDACAPVQSTFSFARCMCTCATAPPTARLFGRDLNLSSAPFSGLQVPAIVASNVSMFLHLTFPLLAGSSSFLECQKTGGS